MVRCTIALSALLVIALAAFGARDVQASRSRLMTRVTSSSNVEASRRSDWEGQRSNPHTKRVGANAFMTGSNMTYEERKRAVLSRIVDVALTASTFGNGSSTSNCTSLAASADPQVNYDAIVYCLNTPPRVAALNTGLWAIQSGIQLPSGSTLRSVDGDPSKTMLRLAASNTANYVVQPTDNSRLIGLAMDADQRLPAGCCSAIVTIAATNVTVSDCIGFGQDQPSSAVGVYFFKQATNCRVENFEIALMHYGVIFAAGLTPAANNIFTGGSIHSCECDSVTIAGYGEVSHTHIYNNGYDCRNGDPPIPGGGIYCLNNHVGAVITDNLIESNCGMLFDHDTCGGVRVTGNVMQSPGNTFGGKFPYCVGSLACNTVDCSDYYFANNTVSNNLASNAVKNSYWGDSNHIFEDVGAAAFSDLPGGGDTVIAFSITTRPQTSWACNTQVVSNNFRADCGAGCTGLGYFAGRGTGWAGAGGTWAPNLFTSNNPFGSQSGSTRCGGNWYAGDTPSCPVDPPPPCNEDDYQHPDTPFRNDPGCGTYS